MNPMQASISNIVNIYLKVIKILTLTMEKSKFPVYLSKTRKLPIPEYEKSSKILNFEYKISSFECIHRKT
jgi:hypothetical protein